MPSKGSPLATMAWPRDLDGELLEVKTAAVEMINLLRQVSVAWYVTFAAHDAEWTSREPARDRIQR